MWTLRVSDLKVNPGPSGQPSCLTDVETKTQKVERPCSGSHSQQGLEAGLEPRTPIPYPHRIEGQCGSAGAGLLLAQASRWAAEDGAPRTLGSLWGEKGIPGARSQLRRYLRAQTRERPVHLCV